MGAANHRKSMKIEAVKCGWCHVAEWRCILVHFGTGMSLTVQGRVPICSSVIV
jgi:hypothetical protein